MINLVNLVSDMSFSDACELLLGWEGQQDILSLSTIKLSHMTDIILSLL